MTIRCFRQRALWWGRLASLKRLDWNGSHWSSASPIRPIFREAFDRASLPYFNPHSFRNTLVRLGEERCKSPEEFKAWSQNLGHEQVLTTFLSYGAVATDRQGAIIRGLGAAPAGNAADCGGVRRSRGQKVAERGHGSSGGTLMRYYYAAEPRKDKTLPPR